ncbi:cAMP-binding domain of CRP or a regulatory subunit of cAMP-dependent protein kinases [Mucilaginibacter sp. OK268]|jgi:CRP-like cAMP-binding protein|uniref:Crp/Fnr family transcriptional regulator n=1 Tax=Mucilaginibacter sp. OK268 TaxID=1881048 RepID=UPI0008907E31|nr:Crp/Fnr family transcriptional regulator [Mucilaginibacter sp. OK268]SDQ01412.1 cAMP-binding domain of CRP or a regulatory subunit of cAMP-dependent protein kinases [Mucilaginibacter sp. OK268]
MSFQLILDNLAKHIHLTPDEQDIFIAYLQSKKIKRKQFLLTDGDICKHSAFVTSGCLRGYTVDKGGIEHVLSFAPPDWWIADMYSLLSQKPGILNIEALEDTEVLLLSKANQEKLYQQIPKFEHFFRILTENSLVASQQRLIDGLSLTAEERYNNFCKRYPTLIDHLPLKQIASYIGVTPEFFSRMRNKRH